MDNNKIEIYQPSHRKNCRAPIYLRPYEFVDVQMLVNHTRFADDIKVIRCIHRMYNMIFITMV